MAFDIKNYLHLTDIELQDYLNYQHLILVLNDKFRTKTSEFALIKAEHHVPAYWKLYLKRGSKAFISRQRYRDESYPNIKYEKIKSFTSGWLLAKRD